MDSPLLCFADIPGTPTGSAPCPSLLTCLHYYVDESILDLSTMVAREIEERAARAGGARFNQVSG